MSLCKYDGILLSHGTPEQGDSGVNPPSSTSAVTTTDVGEALRLVFGFAAKVWQWPDENHRMRPTANDPWYPNYRAPS